MQRLINRPPKAAHCVTLAGLLMGAWQVLADDKATSLADARNAVEANLRMSEGRAPWHVSMTALT